MSGLPYDARVEYLEATGTQYIDTGYKPNQDTRIVTYMKAVSDTKYGRFFGAGMYNTAGSVMFDFESNITGTLHVKFGANSAWTNVSTVKGDYNLHTYDFNRNVFYMDGMQVASSAYKEFQCASSLAIFTYINEGETSADGGHWLKGRCSGFKVYDDDVLVRDFVPVRVGDVGYMYDKVSGKLFGNAGTGSFLIGVDLHEGLPRMSKLRRMIMAAPKRSQNVLYELYDTVFDGTAGSVIDTGITLWDGSYGNWVLECECTTPTANQETVFVCRPDFSPNNGIRLRRTNNALLVTLGNSGSVTKTGGDLTLNADSYGLHLSGIPIATPNTLKITKNGGTIAVECNGHTFEGTINPMTQTLPLLIGCDYQGTANGRQRFFKGTIYKFKLYEI